MRVAFGISLSPGTPLLRGADVQKAAHDVDAALKKPRKTKQR